MADGAVIEASEANVRLDGVIANAMTGLGTSRDRAEYTIVDSRLRLLRPPELDALYMGSWLCRRVVDLIPSEATREGWDIGLGSESAALKSRINKLLGEADKLRIRRHMKEAAWLSRLYGGAAVIMAVDDGTPIEEPINWKRLKAIRGLHVLDRWKIWPAGDWPGLGMPEAYEFSVDANLDLKRFGLDSSNVRIHGTRVLRVEGETVPSRLRSGFQWWGASVLQALWDVFKRFQTGQQSAADILHDFDLYTHRIPDLNRIVAAGREGELHARLTANQLARSVFGAYIYGDGEEIGQLQRSAAGISDILDRVRDEVTGATRIPHTKLWGESPSGLGADGRSEDRAFSSETANWQEDRFQQPLRQFYGTLMRCSESSWGGRPLPEEWRIEFRPTYQPTDEERADLISKVAGADSQYITAGVLRPNEVALSRFGTSTFTLDTTLIDREKDGSIPQEDFDPSTVSFGGDLANPNPNQSPGGGGQAGQPGQGGQAGEEPQRGPVAMPRRDADGEACCPSCGRGEECEEDCEGDSCDEKTDAEQPDDPEKHVHPDKVGQVMHRWKHGTLHSGTGRKGEVRGEVEHPDDQKQAVAIALSMAGKSRRPRGKARRHRDDSVLLPGPQVVAGLSVVMREDGTGQLMGPWGSLTPHQAVVVGDGDGIWRLDGPIGRCYLLGAQDGQFLEALAPPEQLHRVDAVELVSMGIRSDAYDL